ncbi:MAG TPA: hypothetical protein VE650_16250 [Acetobacteraceae bacterium]|nr:hypothetical protein [Acetobacteraceae bacterium]
MACFTQIAAADADGTRSTSQGPTLPAPDRRFPPLAIADRGKVRLGGQGPCFRAIADAGKVRVGGQGPIFR